MSAEIMKELKRNFKNKNVKVRKQNFWPCRRYKTLVGHVNHLAKGPPLRKIEPPEGGIINHLMR